MARYIGYKRPKNTKKTIQSLLHYFGYHKWLLALVILLVFISTAANLMGTYLLKPVINRFILPGDRQGLLQAVVAMAAMYACGAAATLGYKQLMVIMAQKVIRRIRADLFEHVQQLPLPYFDAHTHGELMSRFTNDVDTIQEALNDSFTLLIQSFLLFTGTIAMLMILNFRLSLIVVAFMILMILFIRFSSRRSRRYFQRQQAELARINGFVEEMVAGQKVEKVFNHEKADFEEFCRRNEELRRASTGALTYSGMTIPSIVCLSYINYAISACVGGMLALSGGLDLGSLSSYLVYVRQSAQPLNQFTQQVNFLLAALSGAERIFELMEEPPEEDTGQVTLCRACREADGSLRETSGSRQEAGDRPAGAAETVLAWKLPDGTFRPLEGRVRFENVVFGYAPEKTVLKGISLEAEPGQKIAFVGSTGAGKTTIINLVNRFYEISSGQITYDGINIRDIRKKDLRQSLSMVIQDTHLFTGTIADNIRYGRLDAADEEVRRAAQIANADSFIRRLPQGYDTMLYGDGSNLSQGQRQLLAIARAAVSRPPVLILDEATSSIDTRTERLIEKGMDAIMEGRTVFVIAHRLSTVRNSEKILVLEQRQIIEQGNHEELVAKGGRYYQLYTGQFEME